MTKEEIAEFDFNHSEMTINQRIKLILKEGKELYGFLKTYEEAESFEKMKEKNKWEFIILPQESSPPKITIISGEDIVALEITDTTVTQ